MKTYLQCVKQAWKHSGEVSLDTYWSETWEAVVTLFGFVLLAAIIAARPLLVFYGGIIIYRRQLKIQTPDGN